MFLGLKSKVSYMYTLVVSLLLNYPETLFKQKMKKQNLVMFKYYICIVILLFVVAGFHRVIYTLTYLTKS